MNKTYVKVACAWKCLYQAADNAGATVNFLLIAQRYHKAVLRFLHKAFGQHGMPTKVIIDKSWTNTAAVEGYNAYHKAGAAGFGSFIGGSLLFYLNSG